MSGAELRHQPVRAAFAAFVGSTAAWYAFYLFAAASASIFNTVFFPQQSAFIATMLSFSTLAVGFVARPFGAILFGHFGDRLGRRGALIATLCLMGSATFCIGLIPDFGQIGIWAPTL